MTDIKTALSQALNEWEEPKDLTGVKDYLFKTTNNVTRSTFNAVRDNPGCTRKVILTLLESKGYKLASTTSILSQMVKQRLLREEDDGKLYANFKEYTPLRATSKVKAKPVKKTKAFKEAVATVNTKPIEAAPQPQARQERRVIDIEEWLNEVPLMQARMVYMRLKTIFEGEANA